MSRQTLPAGARADRLEAARHRFLEDGHLPDGTLSDPILRSWLRCREAGVDSDGDVTGGNAAFCRSLEEVRERSELLLLNASGIMEHVFAQIRASGSMVLLADAEGTVLHSLGDPDFVERAQQVALRPGAAWSEQARGTNAIGTALVERMPVEVIGPEHFLGHNGMLTCSAAPVMGPDGRIAGVLDISGDCRVAHRHTLGLVQLSTQLLEKRLFEAHFARAIIVGIHPRPECVGTLQEGLLALNAEGALLGMTPLACSMLDGLAVVVGKSGFGSFSRLGFGSFIDRCSRTPYSIQAIELRDRRVIYARLLSAPTCQTMVENPRRKAMPENTGHEQPSAPAARTDRITLRSLGTGDPCLQRALDRAMRIAGKDIPLIIQGESGVGKELFAQAFHNSGPRASGPFVALNSAAIPENLIESELFGYVGGAFTGARREGARGKIVQADGGTLFLDEIGDMPLNLQARLLRVLQERVVTPVGGHKQVPVNISLVCATHRNLASAVRAGRFREDLYYRINGLTVTLPALRERSDIRAIVRKILATELADERRGDEVTISNEVFEFFERYSWPGNVRQLQNVIRVALALLDDDEREVRSIHLPEELFAYDPEADESESCDIEPDAREEPCDGRGRGPVAPPDDLAAGKRLDQIELDAIARVMQEVGGNVSAAARRLGISRNTLYRKLGRMR